MILRLLSLSVLLLAGCGSGDHEELRRWAAENSRGLQPNIQKLPEMKPYQAVAYDVEVLQDPFRAAKIEPEGRPKQGGQGGLQPDFEARELRNSLLEKYPLESMKMIGYLHVNGKPMAVIQADDKVKQVRVGDYIGQDFGRIKRVTETEIELHEMVQDSAGDWTERPNVLRLQSQDGGKK
jgi:type IV pilus assembly protein PilP